MPSPNEFWLCVHELARAAKAEGPTSAQRLTNISDCFQKMPPSAQREIRSELIELLAFLPDVYPLVLPAGNDNQAKSNQGAA